MAHVGRRLMLLAFLVAAASAWADGKFRHMQVVDSDPTIPRQVGIIAFRDGVETLIVTSDASGVEGEEVAWIIPLPAQPTEMAPVRAGATDAMVGLLGPHFKTGDHGLGSPALVVGIYALLFSFWISVILLTHEGPGLKNRLRLPVYLGLGLSVIVPPICVPNFLTAGIRAEPTLTTLDQQIVGNYDVQVLAADKATDLNDWLNANGFQQFPDDELQVVQDYISEGWVFVVARLQADGRKALQPHPLKFTFPCKSPVFPMRLTASPGQVTNVHLVMIGTQAHILKGFDTIRRERFRVQSGEPMKWQAVEKDIVAHSDTFRITIAHSDIVPLVQQGDWICHLSGRLDAEAMKEDLRPVALDKASPAVRTLYSPLLAKTYATGMSLLVLAVTMPIAAGIGRSRRKAVLPAFVIVLLLTAATGLSALHARPLMPEVQMLPVLRGRMDTLVREAADYRGEVSHSEFEESLKQKLAFYGYSPAPAGPATYEFLRRDNGNTALRIEDRDGKVFQVPLAEALEEVRERTRSR